MLVLKTKSYSTARCVRFVFVLWAFLHAFKKSIVKSYICVLFVLPMDSAVIYNTVLQSFLKISAQ